jgi:hypothetical protein
MNPPAPLTSPPNGNQRGAFALVRGEPTSYWCSFPEPKHNILLPFFYALMRLGTQ